MSVDTDFSVQGGRRRRLLWRISMRVLPIAFAVVVVTQLIVGYLNYVNDRASLATRAELLANLQARALQSPMWNMDSQLIETIVRALEQDPDLMTVQVISPKGEVMFEHPLPRVPGTQPVTARSPITYNDGLIEKELGELRISLSSSTIDKALINQGIAILASAFILILGYSVAMFFALNGTVFRPLDLLLGGMAEVGRHRWVTVQWPTRDEVGQLVGAFNHMVAGLRAGEDARQALREREERYHLALAEEARAEAANRAKSEFLANMSHELRTPLNAIGNYCALVKEELADLGQPHLLADLQNIESASRHLLSIINDVLDLSKIEAGRMDILAETVDIAGLVEALRAMTQPLALNNRNAFVIDVPSDIGAMTTDVTRLRQSLLNLISNAMKFTNDGTVTLRVRAEGDAIAFEVEDTGIGMNSEQLGRLFEPFVQADVSTTKRYGGTGLGLALTRRFVTMMGGTVEVNSTPAKGSLFRIKVPRDPVAAKAQPGERQLRREESCVATLGADASLAGEVARSLSSDGLRVIQVANVAGLERAASGRRLDLILADTQYDPGESRRLADALRRNPELRDVPVVVIENASDVQLRMAPTRLDSLRAPIDTGLLIKTLRDYLALTPQGRVLVVDDERASRAFMARIVESLGMEALEASNGREGFEIFQARKPDLVITDLVMPEMDGRSLAEHIRARPEGRCVPIILATSKDVRGGEYDSLAALCDQIILKGNFTREHLVDSLRYWLAKGQARMPQPALERV